MSQAFPKLNRLLKRYEYLRMAGARRYVGCLIIIEARFNAMSQTRLGITVSRRYGKAHDRNRFKRIVREAFRQSRLQLPSGLDFNVHPRSNAKSATSKEILEEILRLVGENPLKKENSAKALRR